MLGLEVLDISLDYLLRVLGLQDSKQTAKMQFKFKKTPFAATQRNRLKWKNAETLGHSPMWGNDSGSDLGSGHGDGDGQGQVVL